MSNAERNKLLKALKDSTKQAKAMTKAEAEARLVKEGFFTKDGKRTAKYGGTSKAIAS